MKRTMIEGVSNFCPSRKTYCKMNCLISPDELKRKFPSPLFPLQARDTAKRIFLGEDKRLAVLVGPCSIHDVEAALDYARRLKELSQDVEDTLFLIMRVFLEKPRSKTGWKGILYDPFLDASHDIDSGLQIARELLVSLADLGIPAATELLDPLASFYLDDLITWGMIGARTSASQIHRQMASRLSFPVGFKNDLLGSLEPAIYGVLSSRKPHSQIGIDPFGRVSAISSSGNPLTHIVLRGSDKGPNFDAASIDYALKRLAEHGLDARLLIDCSHGNSGKNLERQKEAFISVIIEATDPDRGIAGLMLESHLLGGKQATPEDPSQLAYGVSMTDPCLSWEETEALLRWANEKLALGTVKQ
jgi:3-deoxy-7-phosphoheptulonate synthase